MSLWTDLYEIFASAAIFLMYPLRQTLEKVGLENHSRARGILLRIYGILFCVFIVFAELEWNRFTKYFGFLKYWPARGLFYVFVALITWDQSGSTEGSSYGTYEDIVAFLMMGVGGVYFLLGLACMRTVKEAEAARMAEADA